VRVLLIIVATLFSSCRFYTPQDPILPDTAHSSAQLFTDEQYKFSTQSSSFWWNSFEEQELDSLIDILLKQNLSMKAAVYRLQQSQEQARIQESFQYPEVSAGVTSSRNRSERPGSQITGVDSAPDFQRIFNTFGIGGRVSYEADLWRRIDSLSESADLQAAAADEELQNLVSILIADTARAWIEFRLQSSLEELIEAQIETSATYLSLTILNLSLVSER
jgi:outer membrane protein TolC